MVTGGPRKRFVAARAYRGDSWPRNRRTYSSPRLRFVAWKNMSQRGIREKNRFDTNGTPYLLVATKRESSPRKGNRRHEKTIVAAKRESSPRKGNRRREKRIVATKENRGTNNGGLRRKIVLTQMAPHNTHTTHTQSDYRNPRCACAPRVNERRWQISGLCACASAVSPSSIAKLRSRWNRRP